MAKEPAEGATTALPTSTPATRAEKAADTRSMGERLRGWSRWLRSVGGVVAAVLLWWPFSYSGLADFLHLPDGPAALGVILVGALAASGATALLVSSPWPRFILVFAFPLVCLARTGGLGDYPVTVLVCLLVAVLLGVTVGAYGTSTTMALGLSLAFLVGMSPGGLWKGPFIALALALPFARASLQRVAPTVFGILAVAASWLVGELVGHGLDRGFGTQELRRTTGFEMVKNALTEAWAAVRADASTVVHDAAQGMTLWFLVAAVIAVLIIVVRVVHTRRNGPVLGPAGARSARGGLF